MSEKSTLLLDVISHRFWKYSWGYLYWPIEQFALLHQESRNSHVLTCAKFRKWQPLESPLFKLHPQQPRCHLSHGSQHMLLDLNEKTGSPLVDCFLEQQCRFLLIDSGLGGFYPTKELDKPSALSPVYEKPDQKAQDHKKNKSEGITLRIYT